MTRKFLFCFPLRLGNLVFGYIVITISLLVLTYNLYEVALEVTTQDYGPKFEDVIKEDTIILNTDRNVLLKLLAILYYLQYVVISFLFFVFAALFTCGAYGVNHCPVATFFVYCFFHLFFTISLIVVEALTQGWLQLGLILASDLIIIICLFSIKYLKDAIQNGHIYSHPGEVIYKY